jgi:chaperonin cofactor prefoldin
LIHKQNANVDIVTTDASDIERRIRTYHDQLKTKKTELEKLKQRKNTDALRRQEDELKKQLQVIIIDFIR